MYEFKYFLEPAFADDPVLAHITYSATLTISGSTSRKEWEIELGKTKYTQFGQEVKVTQKQWQHLERMAYEKAVKHFFGDLKEAA